MQATALDLCIESEARHGISQRSAERTPLQSARQFVSAASKAFFIVKAGRPQKAGRAQIAPPRARHRRRAISRKTLSNRNFRKTASDKMVSSQSPIVPRSCPGTFALERAPSMKLAERDVGAIVIVAVPAG